MSDIKMSEIMKGKQVAFSVSMSDGQCLAVIKAVDAYDANQERITDLDELRKNSMSCIKSQRDKITEKSEEIKALKAQVELLRDALYPFLPHEFQYNDGCEHMGDEVVEALNETPQQCLADVRADAELKGAKEFKSYILSQTLSKDLSSHVDGAFILFENKIRDNANES